MVNLFHRYMEYERDSRDRFYFWRSLQVAMLFLYKCKKIGCPSKSNSSPPGSWYLFCSGSLLTFASYHYCEGVFGIPTSIKHPGGSFVCSGSLINFIPSPHVGPSQLWGLRNYLVLPWYLELLYNVYMVDKRVFQHMATKGLVKKNMIWTQTYQSFWSDKTLRITTLLHQYTLSIGNLPLNSFLIISNHAFDSWNFL